MLFEQEPSLTKNSCENTCKHHPKGVPQLSWRYFPSMFGASFYKFSTYKFFLVHCCQAGHVHMQRLIFPESTDYVHAYITYMYKCSCSGPLWNECQGCSGCLQKHKHKKQAKGKAPSCFDDTALQQATEQMTLTSSMATGFCPPTSSKLWLFYSTQMILIMTGMSAEWKSQCMNHIINSVVWNFAFPCISSSLHRSPL